MPLYRYQAIDAKGHPTTGSIEANGFADAAARLEEQGLIVHSIEVASEASRDHDNRQNDLAVPAETINRLRDCSDHVSAALRAYAREFPPGRRRYAVNQVAETLATGEEEDIQQAIADRPERWTALLAATRVADADEEIFAEFLNRDIRGRRVRRLRGAAPAYLVVVASLCLLVLWGFAVLPAPVFREIYQDFGLKLPALTELVMQIAGFFEAGGGWLVIAIGVAAGLAAAALSRWGPAWLPRLAGWIGLPNGEARAAIASREITQVVEAGYAPGKARRLATDPERLPSMPAIDHALSSEVPMNARLALLRDLQACYADRARSTTSRIRGLSGPIAVTAVGVMVGGCAIALFLPLVSLVQALS